jgi:endoglucanase
VLSTMQASSNGYLSLLPSNDYQWGSNSDVLNRAMMLALAYDSTGAMRYLNGVTESMNYLLGRNALNFSFISGYGTQSLAHPHHRFWGNQPANGYPPPPPGVVAGGPNGTPADPVALAAGLKSQPPAKSYIDDMGSFSTNEVAINWNAPLAWVAAYLDDTARPILAGRQSALTPTVAPIASLPLPSTTPVPPTAPPAPPAQPQTLPVAWEFVLGGTLVLGGTVVAAIVILRRRKS